VKGLCGSGLIDAVAEVLKARVITPSGYLRRPDELESETRLRLGRRLLEVDGQRAFVLADAGQTTSGEPMVLTARDVREVQLAKGSINAAILLACGHLGLHVSDLEEVLIAGAFGNYIRKASARRIGLVPAIDPERIRMVGNAAGVGARLALLDRDVRTRARKLAGRTEYVELATRPDYQATFMAMLAFPL
jgi:uncharacterized 2Fe-2S/4Fe-4S cluster protein (DUF4445 family)